MNQTLPPARTRGMLSAALILLLLVLGSPLAVADPAPGPTALTTSATIDENFVVSITGKLADVSGTGIPGVGVQLWLEKAQQLEVQTDGSGNYGITYTLPEPLRASPQQLIVFFPGGNGLDVSQTEVIVEVKPPADERPDVVVTASTENTWVAAGGLVTIAGTLAASDGSPVSGAGVHVIVDGTESPQSLVVTDDAGAFTTFLEVAADRAAGEASLVVSFDGDDNFKAGSAELGIQVEVIPVAGAASPVPAPTVTDTTSAAPEATATVSAGENDDATTTVATGPGPLAWFYVALIIVGGAAFLAAAGLFFRAMHVKRTEESARDAGSLDMLMDDDSDSMLFDDSAEADAAGHNDDSVDSPQPRRGIS